MFYFKDDHICINTKVLFRRFLESTARGQEGQMPHCICDLSPYKRSAPLSLYGLSVHNESERFLEYSGFSN